MPQLSIASAPGLPPTFAQMQAPIIAAGACDFARRRRLGETARNVVSAIADPRPPHIEATDFVRRHDGVCELRN